MFLYLFLAIAGLSVAELYVLIHVGAVIGAIPTIALTILTAIIGASLVRSQGLQTALSVQEKLAKGEVPAQQVVEGVILIIAGACLVMPGFITDLTGMVLLIPWIRSRLAKKVLASKSVHFNHPGQSGGSGNTFDGEYKRHDDDDDHHRLG